MRIDHLKITNFKGFAERTLEFPRSLDAVDPGNGSVHVLIGPNGSGKTTALDAISVALGIWLVGLKGYGSRDIGKGEISVTSSESRERPTFIEQLPTKIDAAGVILNQPVKWSRQVHKPRGKTLNERSGNALSIIREVIERARSQQYQDVLPLLAYYGSGRIWIEHAQSSREYSQANALKLSRFWPYKDCLKPRPKSRDLNQWLLDHDWDSYQLGREDMSYALVKNAMLQCLPGALGIRFAPRRKEVVVAFEGRSEQPFSNLTDGQRNVLALVGDLAVKAVKLNYEALANEVLLKTPGVVLIDEVDLHLHVSWQRVVLENLRSTFPNLQFIATTHSPFIVQSLREGELVTLETQPISEVSNRGIDEIARGLMGIEHPETSQRYQDMKEAAKNYLLTLEDASMAPDEKLELYLERLAQSIDQYADNPAYQAYLELKREGRLGPRPELKENN